MTGDRQDDPQKNQPGQDQAADKQPQGGKIDDRTAKAQEEAAKQRANEGGYQ